MMGTKVVFGLLALFLVAVQFADAQAEDKKKCKRTETYVRNERKCPPRKTTPWETEIEEEEYRVECRCRSGLFIRVRECRKCMYETSTTTVAPTEQTGDVTSVNPVTNPATALPSTEIPDITSPNPSTEVPVIITSENPAPTVPPTEVPSEEPSVPTDISVDTTVTL